MPGVGPLRKEPFRVMDTVRLGHGSAMLMRERCVSCGVLSREMGGANALAGMMSRVVVDRYGNLMTRFCRARGRRTSPAQEQTERRKDYNDQPAVNE